MRILSFPGLVGVFCVALLAAAPAVADMNAMALTCGDMKAADGPGKDAIGRAVLLWTRDTGNAASAGTLPSEFARFNKTDVRQRIEQRCSGKADSANIIEMLRSPA